ncbi:MULTISPECIES: hypothetical protein [unclassified Paenibacillus]|uniref:hypothetical protein n=1 Tax=unclassified Paenibacillus TaxID=185978 RepID=UPI003832918F
MNDLQSKAFPSKTVGIALQALLAVGVICELLILIFTVVYVFANETYYENLYELEQKVTVFSFVLYYICIVIYLIWLVQVHKAIRQKHADYPIRAFGAVVRMIPIFNLLGIKNTFSNIHSYLSRHSGLERKASYIRHLIIPLYFVWFAGGIVERVFLSQLPHMESTIMMFEAIMQPARMIVFYFITRIIHNSLVVLYEKDENGSYSEAEPRKTTNEIQVSVPQMDHPTNATGSQEPSHT